MKNEELGGCKLQNGAVRCISDWGKNKGEPTSRRHPSLNLNAKTKSKQKTQIMIILILSLYNNIVK